MTAASITKKKPVSDALLYVNSDVTRKQYHRRLELFFEFVGLEGEDIDQKGQAFLERARQDETWAQSQIIRFMAFQKQRVEKKELAAGTLKNFYKPIKFFCEFYPDIQDKIPWKRVVRALPRAKQYGNDRAPTIEEIRKLVTYPDRRMKAIVYTMCSSGIRLGAWDFLRWKHVTPIPDKNKTGEIVAAKLIVYAGEPEEHITFTTPEAYFALKEWMDFRASYGEEITGETWVMRNIWRTTDVKRGMVKHTTKNDNFYARATSPEKLSSGSIKRILIRALNEQNLREALAVGVRRHSWRGAHGYRKWFKTRAEQVCNRLNVEMFLGHAIGLNSSYYRPTEQELLTDYLKAVPLLTISENIESLRHQQEILEKKQDEKDLEIEYLKDQLEELQKSYQEQQAKDTELAEMKQAYKDTIKMMQRMQNQVEEQNKKMLQMSDEISVLIV